MVEVRTILDALTLLGPRVDERHRLAGEVGRLERDVSAFVDEVARLTRLMPHVDAAAPPSEASRRLEEAARVVVAARDGLADAKGDLEAARDRMEELQAAVAVLDARKGAMTSLLSVGTLAEVAERLASIARRRELRTRLERAERDVLKALGTASFAEANAVFRDLDREELKARLADAEVLLEACEETEGEAHGAYRKAVDKLAEIGGDDDVARINEERSTILLEIEERAASCLRLRLGVLAAEAAIDLFRDEHKSGLMAAASEAFKALTAGAYARLTSRSERSGETLIALTGTGGSRTAAELSKGTRFQLYLALRIAAYQEYVRSRPSVPFVADDNSLRRWSRSRSSGWSSQSRWSCPRARRTSTLNRRALPQRVPEEATASVARSRATVASFAQPGASGGGPCLIDCPLSSATRSRSELVLLC